MPQLKDEDLNNLAEFANVAQFVSFSPGGLKCNQRFCRVAGLPPNNIFASRREALDAIIHNSSQNAVNVRSFSQLQRSGNKFISGLDRIDDVISTINSLALDGLYTIVNEAIDIHDGGVSGVSSGGTVEFASDDTPRCVEKPGTALLSKPWAKSILHKIYGIESSIFDLPGRAEFSIHPKRCGWRNEHVIGWEWNEESSGPNAPVVGPWPNRFSKMIGDKVYGLLVALEAGFLVPQATFVGRRIKPFVFGISLESSEVWTRTCPAEPDPGRYTTVKGWIDPFSLLETEDKSRQIASIICQDAVPACFSGAALSNDYNDLIIEGVAGNGDRFMLGTQSRENLPQNIENDVVIIYEKINSIFGPARFEWVHDGSQVWILQLHLGKTQTNQNVLVPGETDKWVLFEASHGLEALRTFISELKPNIGITVRGSIGLTSHIADLLRRSKIPSRILD